MSYRVIMAGTIGLFMVLAGMLRPVEAQNLQGECRINIYTENKNREVFGNVHTECGPGHSPPWGNWGVESNAGNRYDGDQFKGWKSSDGHGQWNSCNDQYPWNQHGDDDWFNYPNGTLDSQYKASTHDYGGFIDYVDVNCPIDTDGDSYCDAGGCMDVGTYGVGGNYMDLYELDNIGSDDFVTTLDFPSTSVSFSSCTDPFYCSNLTGSWKSSYSDNVAKAKIRLRIVSATYEEGPEPDYCKSLGEVFNCD